MSSRLVLGTAQFGMRYGISNQKGQVDTADAAAILSRARVLGIDTLDTAIAYGDSERQLGDIGVHDWKVISKLPPLPDGCADVPGWVRAATLGSLRRLGLSRLHGLLLHHSRDLLGAHGETLAGTLLALRDEGIFDRIGVSIYDPEELDAIGGKLRPDIVQAPFNVLDRRLATSGWLGKLCDIGTEVHARSVFLQGLLLMKAPERPVSFDRWQAHWTRWERWLRDQGQDPLRACMAFVLNQAGVSRVVIGVVSEAQLADITACLDAPAVMPPAGLAIEDPDLINPSRWNIA